MTKLDDDTTRDLDALNMIEAFAGGDQEAAFWTAARYEGQQDKLASPSPSLASRHA
jgi:hypothetical protein